jgi:hypothetical protein
VAAVALAFLAWVPVLPRWLRGRRPIDVIFAADGLGPPIAVRWGGAEESVDVLRTSSEVREGHRRHRLQVRLLDGSVLDLARDEPGGTWEIERERDEYVPEPGT